MTASLLAAPACCDNPETTKKIHALRALRGAQIDACLMDERECMKLCRDILALSPSYELYRCVLLGTTADGADLEATYGEWEDCAMGRPPCGYVRVRDADRTAGAWLARAANLEAASAIAFVRLVDALVELDAPAALVEAARRAVADELHHAAICTQLARDFGAEPTLPLVHDVAAPSVFELACENAVAGQVGETHAALVALCQSRLATDARIRAAFTIIAADETRHAQLSEDLAAFLAIRLTATQNAQVDALRRDAAAALRHEFSVDDGARVLLGLPATPVLAAASAALFATV
jgi:hypothetical protein